MSDFLSFHLSNNFIKKYETLKPNWSFDIGGNNSLSELTFLTKYSRIKDNGQKEQWFETCRRCVEGTYSILREHCRHQRTPWNEFKAQKAAEDAYDRMFNFKWSPPGRGMAMMGTRFVHEEQNNGSLINPLHVETPILTRDGWVAIGDLQGQKGVKVLSSSFLYGRESGKFTNNTPTWVEADISDVEMQPSIKISYRGLMGKQSSVIASVNHRWFIKKATHHNWKRVTGNELEVGDFLPTVKPHIQFKPSRAGMQHGFFFGDGDRGNGILTQFGSSTAVLSNLFGESVHYAKRSAWVGQCPLAWAFLPEGRYGQDQRYVYGFLAGYFAADGTVGKDGACSISSARPEEITQVRNLFLNLGIDVSLPKISSTSSNYKKERELWIIRINRFDLQEQFFLKAQHRERWLETTYGKLPTKKNARITSITSVGEQPVLCATVPGYEQFVIQDFIMTSNCAMISTEKLSSHSAQEATMPFTRLMEMSMHGCGCGIDTAGVGKLTIHEPDESQTNLFVIPDSREGWAQSVGILLESYFFKNRIKVGFDYSQIRPAGTRLKRFGGTSSGPLPLQKLHESICKQFAGRNNEQITSRDIVDIANKIGKAVVAGGARRSALISLGRHFDEDYVNLKNWNLPENAERTGPDGWANTSNNSVLVNVDDDLDHLTEMIAVNGEPGILWLDQMRKFGRLADPANNKDYRVVGSNPCSEISLESHENCNLVELYPSHHDNFDDFKRSIKHGYMYAKAVTLMPSIWPETNEVTTRNRRIGVSITGIVEFIELHSWHQMQKWMDEGYLYLSSVDKKYSEWLGVRESIKLSTVKPSGTTSIIAGTTAGIHWPVASAYYIRRVRYLSTDPIVDLLKKAGYEVEPDIMSPDNTVVVSFPTKGLNIRSEKEVSIWEKAQLAVMAQRYWADNMVSVTISYKEEEQKEIKPLLKGLNGQLKSISFLPIDGSGVKYKQIPFEPLAEEEAIKMMKKIKNIDINLLYENGLEAEGEKYCTTDTCII